MLLDFTFSNYKSVNEKVTLSMERIKKLREDDIDATNVIHDKKSDVLKSAIIYGANASGKTNVVKAMSFMRDFVINSAREGQSGDDIPVFPFKFVQCDNPASMFEIRFRQGEREYRYGFELTTKKVVGEWLYIDEKEYFNRIENDFHLTDFPEGKSLQTKTRTNALFISVCANFNGDISKQVIGFFYQMRIVLVLESNEKPSFKNEYFDRLTALIRVADVGISGIIKKRVTEKQVEEFAIRNINGYSHYTSETKRDFLDMLRNYLESENDQIMTEHIVDDVVYELPLNVASAGTHRLIDLSVFCLEAIDENLIFIIDEFDARLHPLLSRELIRYFHKESKQAQLIMTTHDVTLMKSDSQRLGKPLFRRDQIWLLEKNHQQETRLYSLAEFKKDDGASERRDASYEKKYLEGRYGGIPILEDFSELTHALTDQADEP